ncbi:hypothetical protein LEP1GSC072_1749 [Leptospira noguchii str. Bonito]|nr:hypothetical protein LEP1GSC072_1749 [Leptospira noguchii str. Bonito]
MRATQAKLENFSIYKYFKIFFIFDIIICILSQNLNLKS